MACLFFVNIQIDDNLGYCSVEQCFLEKEPSNTAFPEIQNEVHRLKYTEGGDFGTV